VSRLTAGAWLVRIHLAIAACCVGLWTWGYWLYGLAGFALQWRWLGPFAVLLAALVALGAAFLHLRHATHLKRTVSLLLAFIVHEATALYDVSYALPRRHVGVLEQHVHSFMEVLPFVALLFVTILNWDQCLALVGLGGEPPRFELKLKTDPIPAGYLLTLLSSILFFMSVPYTEELWRCMKVERHRLVKPNIAQAA